MLPFWLPLPHLCIDIFRPWGGRLARVEAIQKRRQKYRKGELELSLRLYRGVYLIILRISRNIQFHLGRIGGEERVKATHTTGKWV